MDKLLKSSFKCSFKGSFKCPILAVLLICWQATALAQTSPETEQTTTETEQTPLDLKVASDGNVSQSGDILRLEETIRGNKEQPKVLSIVPWQLPLHQRIDRNEQRWAPIKTQLKPLERNSFLKEIKLLEGIQSTQSNAPENVQSN